MDIAKENNLTWQETRVTRKMRETLNGHRSILIWLTGLSGSGKSTLALAVEELLHKQGRRTHILDGDNIRHGLCSDLGFSDQDRQENIRRIGETAKLLVDAGVIVLAAFISPFKKDRQRVRNLLQPGDCVELYCKCSLEVCEERDVKGLYKRARAGEIRHFTGISSPYEPPVDAELVINTDSDTIQEAAQKVMDYIEGRIRLDH